MTFFSFYAQPSCTPGRAAMQTGRIPEPQRHDDGGLPGQGGGLPKAEWTLASVLKQVATRPTSPASGIWVRTTTLTQRAGLRRNEVCRPVPPERHTYGDPTWFPDMDPELRAMFNKVTIGSLFRQSGREGKGGFQDQRAVRQRTW